VNRVAAPGRLEEEVTSLAERMAAMPPFAVRTVKRSINDALDFMGQGRSWEHQFRLHVAGKRSEEFREWWRAVEQQGGGFRPGVHPTAFLTVGTYVIGRVTVGARASIWFGAVLRGDFEPIRVGEESLIEDNVVLQGAWSSAVDA